MIPFTVNVHLFFLLLILLIYLKNLYVLFTVNDFITLSRKIRFFGPMLHFFLSATFFLGIILSVFTKDYRSIEILIMYGLWLFFFISEIKRYKKIRSITSKEPDTQQRFIQWAKKLYGLNLLLLIGSSSWFLLT